MPLHIYGEIMYGKEVPITRPDDILPTMHMEQVHSDMCTTLEQALTDDYRKFLHDSLDEWLNNQSNKQVNNNKNRNSFYLMLSEHDH